MSTTIDLDLSDSRMRIVKRLHADLIGPLQGSDEVLTSRPSDVYLSGILWPNCIGPDPEDNERLNSGKNDSENTSEDGEENVVAASSVHKPSVAGVSFCIIPSKQPSLTIQVGFGRYVEKLPDKKEEVTKWCRRDIFVSIDDLDPFCIKEPLDLADYLPSAKGAFLNIRMVKTGEVGLITVSLINKSTLPKDASRAEREANTFFQTSIKILPNPGTHLVPKPPRVGFDSGGEDHWDEQSNALLFRDVHEFAVGHICSAEWGSPHKSCNGVPEISYVSTTWIPSEIVLGVSSSGDELFTKLPEDVLDAGFISKASPKSLHWALNSLCDAYEDWIRTQEDQVINLSLKHTNIASRNLENCRTVLKRLRNSAGNICKNKQLRTAFQLANQAMLLQHGWDKEKAMHGPLKWRPFQLAFILLSAPSTAIKSHIDRSVMDLLWFPTGGGKTEAYLGLIAFIAFYRRLSRKKTEHSGVVAIMRYTLRLLTTQQFARSSAMILACEFIRKGGVGNSTKPKIYGDEPFSIGLWVGNGASPNKRSDAYDSLRGTIEQASPKQLANCPCCGEKLAWPIKDRSTPIQPFCENKICDLFGPLPVWTVDEDIYERKPTLLVGTIDKFALIVRKPEINKLFSCLEGDPPDLILQDELHLISGPLGTITGLYETAIDLMFSPQGYRPKIIGSTATIRRASEQVKDLFDRTVCQFPPPGINEENSGFAKKKTESDGRRYLGITTAGRSAKFVLQSVAASLMQSVHAELDSLKEKDPYQTLVEYFNSLKELGGALVLMQDDVYDTISIIAEARNETPRRVNIVEELTSRRTQEEILKMLSKLAIPAGKPGCVDTVLATNMVSVGVDIPRLGLMVVNGQPKTTAEYIQSTSRVGRGQVSGLVVTILNNSKARDRSHFETFRGWHEALYRDIEATSVTPFASRARDRALHAALVAAVRHLVPEMLDSPASAENHKAEIIKLIDRIVERAERIDPEEADVRSELIEKYNQWVSMVPISYWDDFRPQHSLLQSAEKFARNVALGRSQVAAWPTLNSMRDVEAGTPFKLIEVLKKKQ